MKKSAYNFNGRQSIFLAFLCIGLLTGIGFLINYKAQAETDSKNLHSQKNNYALKSFSARRDYSPPVNIGERTSVWLKLEEGKSLDTTFYGNDEAISALRGNLAEPTAQVSADINLDGYNDLVSGFRNAAGGGLIALHRASRQAFAPTDEDILAGLRRGVFPATFEKDALILEVPTVPDFIFAGRFVKDSDLDLVFASRGGTSLFVMSSDGKGGFGAAREIPVGGEITALVSEKIDFSQVYTGVIAAVTGGKSSNLLVFSGKTELSKTTPRSIAVGGRVDSLITALSDSVDPTIDLFGLADGRIFTVYGIGSAKGGVNPVDLPFRAVDFAVGEFIRDRRGKREIAVLSEDGNVSYLTHGSLDTRPYANGELAEFKRGENRFNSNFIKPEPDNAAEGWTPTETHQLGVYSLSGDSPARILRKAYITGNETEDLMVVNAEAKRVQILFKEPNTDENRTSFTGETKFQNVDFADAPTAILPMRLNVMGQQGFVVFNKGNLEPTPVMLVPNATFVVSKTPDTNDTICDADCSVREAIVHSNAMPGADMVTFGVSGTHQLTIDFAGVDNNSAEGDLDVLQALTVVGNGTGNTIITAGTTTANGIDKIFSVNPFFSSAFASSFTGMTMRFGRNPSTFALDGWGGALDWDGTASGMGTISMSNVNVDQNRTTDGLGGGLLFSRGAGGSGVTLSSVNVTSNVAARTNPATGVFGGGIGVGFGTAFSYSTGSISNNQTAGNALNGGLGGGIYLQSVTLAGGDNSNFSSVTVTGNSSQDRGGGIYTERGLTFTAPTIISNNSTGINGGGLAMNVFMTSVNISKATMVGNSATTSGGAIDVGSQTGANGNILNMSFSRIVGNTGGGFTGLLSRGGTANVENNWWGCNTGPSAAPCNTAGASGGSVDFDPWLQLRLTAGTTTPVVGQSTGLTASFLLNSAGGAVAASNLDVLIGLTVSWSASGGTISGQQTTIQSNGTATANFSSSTAGGGKSATAQVDNGPATVSFTVGKANTTTLITAESADPTAQGEVFTVFYTVSVTAPGAGTPTGNVTVTDGANSCVGTVAAGQCSLFLNNVGLRTLTATYGSDANFNGSVSPGEPHTVLPIVAASVSISGRVQTASGRGIANARVTITDQNGETVTAISNGFGYYRFDGIQVGQLYFFNVRHKEYQFTPQAVTVNEDIVELNFTALE